MNVRLARVVAIFASAVVHPLPAQTPTPATALGTWRGTSLCLVHPSGCHDENVVYRITPTTTRDSVSLDGRKIVNGVEEEMGVLGCRFNPRNAGLTCQMRNGVWNFTVHGDSLTGELLQPNGTKFRDVRTARSR